MQILNTRARKDYAPNTYKQDYEQRRFDYTADVLITGIGGIVALVALGWLIACAFFNTLVFNL